MKHLAREIKIPIRYKLIYIFLFTMEILTNLVLINDTRQLVTFALAFDLASFYRTFINFLVFLILNIFFIFFDQKLFRTITTCGELLLKKYTLKSYLDHQEYIEQVNPAILCSKMNQDVVVLSNWLSIGRLNQVCQFLFLFIYTGAMLAYNIPVTVITVLMIGIVFLLTRKISTKQSVYFSRLKSIQEKLSLAIHNDFLNQFAIVQLGIVKFIKKKLNEIVDQKAIRKFALYTSLNESMLTFMTQFIPIVVLCLGMAFLKGEQESLGTALSLMLIAQKLNEPVLVIAELFTDQKNAEQVYERIRTIYEPKTDQTQQKPIAKKFEQLDLCVRSYTYQTGTKATGCKLLRAKIDPGEIVEIKGTSGCGKSTLFKLITRLIDPEHLKGQIVYNGMSIEKYERNSLYRHILLVEQEAPIIEGTLKENLELGDSFSDQEIRQACEQAGLGPWLKNHGLEFEILENGKNLSGGEKRRIAIARMLLRKPEVLLLDEAFTGIEENTRRIILHNLLNMVEERKMTILAISHEADFSNIATQTLIMQDETK